MRLVERVIYLPDFDIAQNGNVGCLARRDAEKNLLTYVLFYDQVRLQSSAFLKVGGMYDIGLRRPELFAAAGGDALVSMGIERSIECYESYAEGRFSVLTRESGERNPELRAYASNNAFERARFLDSLVGSNQIRRPKERVEDLFRSEVRRGVHGFDWGDYTEKAVKLIVSYSEGADFFQTFDLEERLRDNVPEGLVQKYAKALRGCYYRANALVFGGLEHTWHSQLENMRPYMTYVLGVTGNDLLRLGTWSICEIKCNSAFQYLVDVYFSLEEQAESEFLCSLCQADFPLKTLFRRADRHLVDLALSVKRVRKDFMSFYSEEVLRRRWIR